MYHIPTKSFFFPLDIKDLSEFSSTHEYRHLLEYEISDLLNSLHMIEPVQCMSVFIYSYMYSANLEENTLATT